MKNIHVTPEYVKTELMQQFSAALDTLFQLVDADSTPRQMEEATWNTVLSVGASTLGALFGSACLKKTKQDIAQRELPQSRVHMRMDQDYWATLTSTFGAVIFPWCAYRELGGNGASVTRNPAQDLFPGQKSCRSTPLCLEWETWLGSDYPFRSAQEALTYFTHGAVRLEDTTIERHMVSVGELVTRDFLYRTPEEIQEILLTRATRDRETNLPLLYASSDAHALRRYVDATWAAQWKMANGIRLWCEDQKTGQVIHLGGEFTWGDCHEVQKIFKDLIARGILTSDGMYENGIQAQLVWLSDGMPWFKDYIIPLFTHIVVILDVYHLLHAFAAFFALCFTPQSKQSRIWLARVATLAVGPCPPKKAPKLRGGPRRGTTGSSHGHAHNRPVDLNADPVQQVIQLLLLVFQAPTPTEKAQAIQSRLFFFLFCDPNRVNYLAFRARGYQIGSGAMESLHRTGSQKRLKLPGASWLERTSQAVFNIRMMRLAGNYNRFWNQPDLLKHFSSSKQPI